MSWFGWAGIVICAGIALVALWVRLAPSDPARWHTMPEVERDADLPGGAMRVIGAGPEGLARLDRIIRATARTDALAGSVGEGMVTYVTRSRVFGFPDYTTVRQEGQRIAIFGRARFGKSDLGVNAARIDGWLETFGQRG
ncbi:DUF1499 domain-containing protein [Roseovarius spongiae]|uniref:DUF1499 domain-containing protein n=1 Tax=Roseovarius spongiae TaxID=2320272 RepID=A0A3A8B5M9_9RHOB|nr:DUF1499 domain-containing protein [Roseovarius spongiae]RKF15076.1 DUF1499 domain-containing protein [Roseovarius spongiae]